jgi:8-oxo-dGTP diphosphatase
MIDTAHEQIIAQYGQHLRVRVCGICVQEDKILMIKHSGVVENGDFWSPPGGGLNFGEATHDAIKREFLEETSTEISIKNFLFISEFIHYPLHAIELFFEVTIEHGKIKKGSDPEMEEQIIQEVRWMSFEEIKAKPPHEVSRIFSHCDSLAALLALRGMV